MVRIRAPGGVVTPRAVAGPGPPGPQHANGSLRLTTRQSFQFHGVIKWKLKQTIARDQPRRC